VFSDVYEKDEKDENGHGEYDHPDSEPYASIQLAA
jgi:hypothetical protein